MDREMMIPVEERKYPKCPNQAECANGVVSAMDTEERETYAGKTTCDHCGKAQFDPKPE